MTNSLLLITAFGTSEIYYHIENFPPKLRLFLIFSTETQIRRVKLKQHKNDFVIKKYIFHAQRD